MNRSGIFCTLQPTHNSHQPPPLCKTVCYSWNIHRADEQALNFFWRRGSAKRPVSEELLINRSFVPGIGVALRARTCTRLAEMKSFIVRRDVRVFLFLEFEETTEQQTDGVD